MNKQKGSIEMNKQKGSIEMNKQKRWFWITGGLVILIAGLVVGGLGLFDLLPWQKEIYEDPQGRYTMEVGPGYEQVQTDGSYTEFAVADPPMNLYLLVLDAPTINEAFSQTMDVVGFDQGLLAGGGSTTLGDWEAYSQNDAQGLSYGLAGQIVGENAFVFMVRTNKPGLDPASPAVAKALNSVVITGKVETKIESYADVEAMVQKKVDSLAGSVSLAVIHKDEIVYTYAYGQANPVEGIRANTQTIYAIGSMTKPFTAAALMQLVEQGRVGLDAWPGEYISEFPESWKVTVRQLLDHSACLENSQRLTNGLIAVPGESFAPLDELFSAYVKDYPNLVCEPGKVSNYSNSHYLALARIIEEVSGEPYDTYVIDHLLTPLAMDSSSFELVEPNERYAKEQYLTNLVDGLLAEVSEYRGPGQESLVLQTGERYSTLGDYRVLPPWGGLRSSPSDITHFLQMFLNGGRYGENQILQPETVAAMQAMQTSTDGSDLGFGLSWWIGEDEFGEFIYHGGFTEGSEALMRYYPDLDLGVVIMANVPGYQPAWIAEALVSAWQQEK